MFYILHLVLQAQHGLEMQLRGMVPSTKGVRHMLPPAGQRRPHAAVQYGLQPLPHH
jgi:hypothetical protein